MQAAYLEAIRRSFPDVQPESIALNRSGQNSDVLIVDGQLVFRFPRYAHVIDELVTEVGVLRALQGRLPLDIPDPTYVQLEGRDPGEAFVGHRMLPGEPLWRDTYKEADPETRDRLAAQFGRFLYALHSVPAREVIPFPLPRYDTREECADIYARIRAKLFPHMRPDARAWAEDHFERYLDEGRHFAYAPVLKHGDFGPSNILHDRSAGRVSGIIDFGGVGLGDPAYDFAGLLSGYGEALVQRCCAFYPGLEAMLERVWFYRGTFALLEALFGVENDDPEAYRDGMAEYV
jgi:aminoglycoside 2''-phosphotransferase